MANRPERTIRMSVTIVNDYRLKADADKAEALAAAAELVKDFNRNQPGIQLSLWLEDQNEPLHHFHITVFDDQQAMENVRSSEGIQRFVERFYPHMDQSTHLAPTCDVWLLDGHGVKNVAFQA
jgi:quinol monooxygenase YgiN